MVLFAHVIGTAIDGPAVWLDFWRLSVGRARASGRMAYATCFVEARLVSERKANPCDNRIPLALFGSGIIDQDTIHVSSGPVAAIVPGPVFANARYGEKNVVSPSCTGYRAAGSSSLEKWQVNRCQDWERTARLNLLDDPLSGSGGQFRLPVLLRPR
jgi:hypothetical protein